MVPIWNHPTTQIKNLKELFSCRRVSLADAPKSAIAVVRLSKLASKVKLD